MDLLFKVKSEDEMKQVLSSENASLFTESDSFLENYVHSYRRMISYRMMLKKHDIDLKMHERTLTNQYFLHLTLERVCCRQR